MKVIEVDEGECNKIGQEIDTQKKQLEKIRKEAETSAEKYQKEVEEIQKEWNEAA